MRPRRLPTIAEICPFFVSLGRQAIAVYTTVGKYSKYYPPPEIITGRGLEAFIYEFLVDLTKDKRDV